MALPPDNIVIKRSKRTIADTLFDTEAEEISVEKNKKSRAKKIDLPNEAQEENPPSRQVQIIALFLALSSILLLLALLSYTSKDEANAEMSLYDIISVLKGDPIVQAKSDTTLNWLGLFGAVISNTLFNKTIGYSALIFPFLGLLWSKELFFQQSITIRTIKFTGLLLLIAGVLSGFLGTIQLIIPGMNNEWCGLIGQFESHVVSSLIGKTGSILVFFTAGFLTITIGFGLSINAIVVSIISFIRSLYVSLSTSISHYTTKNDTIDEELVQDTSPITNSKRAILADAGSDEPARIIRKVAPPTSMLQQDIQQSTPVIIRGNEFQEDQEPAFINYNRAVKPLPKSKTESVPSQLSESPSLTKEVLPPLQETEHTDIPALTLNVQEPIIQSDDLSSGELAKVRSMVQDEEIHYAPPTIELLTQQNEHVIKVDDEELKENARLLQEKLLTFKIEINDLQVTPGPVVTQYEFVPAAGNKISQIENLANDIALALKARGIRIIAPVPGRGTVAIEIPNHNPSMVLFSSIIKSAKFHDVEQRLPLALGKTISGEVYCADLTKMPHLLIAGSTGAGKSVGINTVICSLLYKMHPKDLKFVIIDPKKVEMTYYSLLRNHFLALSPDTDEQIITNPQNAVAVLKSLCVEMMNRYDILAKVGQRNIVDYNTKLKEGKYLESYPELTKMPYIVCVIDELADLMLTAGKEVEEPIIRLAQLARAVGIHMIIATQRPSVDVITGLIKANFPARISYQVASKIDSRTIIDGPGADQLLGNGDMLFLPGGLPKPIRIQNSFLSTDEVENICMHIANQQGYSTPYMLPTAIEKGNGSGDYGDDTRDELFNDAARIVVRHQQGSTSLLQRHLKVGYARAARIIDQLEAAGIVGSPNGSKGREVMINSEIDLDALL